MVRLSVRFVDCWRQRGWAIVSREIRKLVVSKSSKSCLFGFGEVENAVIRSLRYRLMISTEASDSLSARTIIRFVFSSRVTVSAPLNSVACRFQRCARGTSTAERRGARHSIDFQPSDWNPRKAHAHWGACGRTQCRKVRFPSPIFQRRCFC